MPVIGGDFTDGLDIDSLKDGEVLGLDLDGTLVLWDSENQRPYNCGETLEEFGISNLYEHEKPRVLS